MKAELERKIKEILCRQCDGLSHADTCDLPKTECPVLLTAPEQLYQAILSDLAKENSVCYNYTCKDRRELWLKKPITK